MTAFEYCRLLANITAHTSTLHMELILGFALQVTRPKVGFIDSTVQRRTVLPHMLRLVIHSVHTKHTKPCCINLDVSTSGAVFEQL